MPPTLLQAVSAASFARSDEFYVGWGTLALINANLAQLKGRSGLGWFVGSLVVGPLATLALCIVGPGARDDAAVRRATGTS